MSSDSSIQKIIERLGPDRQAIWSLMQNSGSAAEGLTPTDEGWCLKAGRSLLFFDQSPCPNLTGYADLLTHQIWADAHYQWRIVYSVGGERVPAQFIQLVQPGQGKIVFSNLGDCGWEVVISGGNAEIQVKIIYRLPENGLWLDESIVIANVTNNPVRLADWDFGLARGLSCGGGPCDTIASMPDLEGLQVVAIPWRRQMHAPDTLQDYDLKGVIEANSGQNVFAPDSYADQYMILHFSKNLPSDAWAFCHDNSGLLVMKYAPQHIEYSVLRHVSRECLPDRPGGHDHDFREERHRHMVFGGSARCHDDPCPGLLGPDNSYCMGLTRYHLFQGSWHDAFNIHRETMDFWGCSLPDDYQPDVIWNEFYDNRTYSSGENLDDAKEKYYRIEDMKLEAEKAVAYGCEALLLDIGWDTRFASSIWDEKRLGPAKEFIEMIRHEYGLKTGLSTPLAGWCDPLAFPESSYRLDRAGKRHQTVCGGSVQFLEAKAERLKTLAESGASFLMFDGSFYTGSCYDPLHGHPIPYTRDEHVKACQWLSDQVHHVNPAIQVSMHDLLTVYPDLPGYLGYSSKKWDEKWAWEMWWESLEKLKNGKALTLYYFNLAYSVPLYLHINLGKENENGILFWWFASTVRHLGFGGTNENLLVQELLKKSMKLYRYLKVFYTQGEFIGLGETAHLHVKKGQKGGVLNLFNLKESDRLMQVAIPCQNIKTGPGTLIKPGNLNARWIGDALQIDIRLKAMSPLVIRLIINDHDQLVLSDEFLRMGITG